ncbi:uncharacterized protein B0T23DRAFT_398660 [Neurospora hispaniola]|uniref:Uncharacterized protein n=1 Tax=Neurospora hispaniola TaxID=588809 RepID=A0AAJ0I288_9PEZI|nr:hypothetical protein B0T23DRAFT_398660 [Neurospora hispaniola]
MYRVGCVYTFELLSSELAVILKINAGLILPIFKYSTCTGVTGYIVFYLPYVIRKKKEVLLSSKDDLLKVEVYIVGLGELKISEKAKISFVNSKPFTYNIRF